jgi:hypothetical protein
MIRIAISAAAFDALAATLPLGSVGYKSIPPDRRTDARMIPAAILTILQLRSEQHRDRPLRAGRATKVDWSVLRLHKP